VRPYRSVNDPAMNRQQLREQALRLNSLLDDLWHLDSIQATTNQIVLAGEARVPVPDFEVTANGRLLAAGYQQARIEHVPTYQSPWRLLITVPLAERAAQIPWLNIGLFAATVATMLWIGGMAFTSWFLAILLCHEFGHFLMARRHHIDASWPYFIPAPNILGTFGAFIRLRSPIRDRIGLFDMAVAGPLAGFVVAIVALVVGLMHSTVVTSAAGNGLSLGDSLLFKFLTWLLFPGMAANQDILLHPIAFAGWAGLLVTMLNLLPMGQLDGGHIAYALFPRQQKWLASATLLALAIASFWWPWWLIWAAIGLFLRPGHPPTLMDEVPLGRGRILLGCLAFAIFIISFMPVPFNMH